LETAGGDDDDGDGLLLLGIFPDGLDNDDGDGSDLEVKLVGLCTVLFAAIVGEAVFVGIGGDDTVAD
jgi:hypothetical protein